MVSMVATIMADKQSLFVALIVLFMIGFTAPSAPPMSVSAVASSKRVTLSWQVGTRKGERAEHGV